jgi:hypothetical protein
MVVVGYDGPRVAAEQRPAWRFRTERLMAMRSEHRKQASKQDQA